MTMMTPYKLLSETAVTAQPDEFITTVVVPWLREVSAHHKRFRTPPWRPPTQGGLMIVKSTRWAVPSSVAEIAYYVAADPDGHEIARDEDNAPIIAWAPTPVPLPIELEALAIDPTTGKRRL